MKYKQIKWLILMTPTVTIALWEYLRHEFLLSLYHDGDGEFSFSTIRFYRDTRLFTAFIFSFRKNARRAKRGKDQESSTD